MPQLPPELQGQLDRTEAQRWDDRNVLRSVVKGGADDFVAPGGAIKQWRVKRNSHTLLAGEHGGWDIFSEETLIRGAPGSTVTRHVRFDGTALVEGVTFYAPGNSNNNDQLVTIGPEAVVIFNSCRFYKEPNLPATFIAVEAGGKVILNGVDFAPTMATTGNVIDNAGVALDVMVIGANRTGLTLGTASATAVV